MPTSTTPLEQFLERHDDADWRRAAAELQAETDDVDRTAVRIWLAFHPLTLARALDAAEDPRVFARRYLLEGQYRLTGRIDTSHRFLYGRRYWPEVRRAVLALAAAEAAPVVGPLAAIVRQVAQATASAASVDRRACTAIAIVAVATLQQIGREALAAAAGTVSIADGLRRRTPAHVLAARARDDGQGLFGFLRGEFRRWTVTIDEQDPDGRFPLVHTQALTTAAAEDRRDWRARDPRCTEGAIPVQCRSASCGTCWVGVLGGAEKLSPVEPRERRTLAEFGYSDTDDPQPVIRLACQARAMGAVSIVIPPWNGVFGALVPKPDAASTLVGAR